MRVKQALACSLLAGCACCYPLALSAQALHTPTAGPKPLSSEQSTPKPAGQLLSTNKGILDADSAFGFRSVINSDSVLLNWTIQAGYYLYQSKLAFTDSNGKTWTSELPPATTIVDEFMGESRVYYDALQLRLPLPRNPLPAPANYSLSVQFQGCAKDRYCYPPQIRTIPLASP